MVRKTNFKKVCVLALSMSILGAGAAGAASGTSKFVKDVSLTFIGQAAQITIKNEAGNKHINALKLAVQETQLNFEYAGSATCKNGNAIQGLGSYMFFGPVSINGEELNSFSTLYDQSNMLISWHDGDKFVEYSEGTFNVPLNKLKQGHPALRVDALDELEKKAQTYVQGGGTLVDFYRQDQHLVLQRPISLAAFCRNNNNWKGSFGYETKDHTIQITYKGDPALFDGAVVNPKLKLGESSPKGFEASDTPFKLTEANFMPNIPHYVGKCVPDENPVVRINFKSIGSTKGVLNLSVMSESTMYGSSYGPFYTSGDILIDPQISSHLDFQVPLKQMLNDSKYDYMAISGNETYHHKMEVKARWKPAQGGEWSNYETFDTAVFNHRCIGQAAIPLGGTGKTFNGQNDPKPPLLDKVYTPKPGPKPIDKFQAIPVTPTPKSIDKFQPVPVTPTEKPKRATN